MGFFSWRTSDTNEPIWNQDTEKCRPVYLLCPKGEENILEPSYEGYGSFGGVDVYIWLAQHNLSVAELKAMKTVDAPQKYLRALSAAGIAMDLSNYYEDPKDGSRWAFGGHAASKNTKVNPFTGDDGYGTYESPQEKYDGKTPNELIHEGVWVRKPMRELIMGDREYMPLKFSFDKDAVYEDLPAAENHQGQGFWDDEEQQEIVKKLCQA